MISGSTSHSIWKQLSMMICFFNDRNQVAETLVLIGSRCVRNLLRKSVSGCFFSGEFHPWSIHVTWWAGHVSVMAGFNEAKSRCSLTFNLWGHAVEAYFWWPGTIWNFFLFFLFSIELSFFLSLLPTVLESLTKICIFDDLIREGFKRLSGWIFPLGGTFPLTSTEGFFLPKQLWKKLFGQFEKWRCLK